MYEQFFGLTAPPFQLNPDPSFYFQSTGHNSAHQYLRFGAFQGEGFIVVTGEIGAGKTTLLRTLLAELDPAKVVAAQIVSTQLEAGELLSAVALAFGIACEGMNKAKLLVTLEAYFASLATTNRRALLIIDEAQNLGTAAIEELRMLSNFQFGNKALLQSFLVGQPELRDVLRLPQMEQLRQRIIASTHIGPMDEPETRAYIEHRLRHVGWKGRPAFSDDAYKAVHAWTNGVPRRINTLCSRMLLSAFLDNQDSIDVNRVDRVAREIQLELTGSSVPPRTGQTPTPEDARRPTTAVLPADLERIPLDEAETPAVSVDTCESIQGDRAPGTIGPEPIQLGNLQHGQLFCVATSQAGLIVMGALLRAFRQREDLPPARLVQILAPDAICDAQLAASDIESLDIREAVLTLENQAPTAATRMVDLMSAFVNLLNGNHPSAVVLGDDSGASVICALAAKQSGIPVVRIHAGLRHGDRTETRESNRALIDQASTLLCASERAAIAALQAEGMPASWLEMTGNPLVDAMQYALPACKAPAQTFKNRHIDGSELLGHPKGYALVWTDHAIDDGNIDFLIELRAALFPIGKTIPLIWPMPAAIKAILSAHPQSGHPESGSLIFTPPLGYLEILGFMREATCVFTDSGWIQDQTTALGIPCLTVATRCERQASLTEGTNVLVGHDIRHIFREMSEILDSERKAAHLPELWDGHATNRIALQLSNWLLARQDGAFRAHLEEA